MSENQIQIIEIELLEKNRQINLQQLFTQKGMDAIIGTIKKEVANFEADVSTKEGRAKIISMAAKVARCKSPIKELATELKEDSRKFIDGVNSQLKRYETEMDTLRDEIRKPVDEIEKKEAAELKAKQDQLGFLEHLKNYIPDSGFVKMSESYANALKRADELMNFDWQDFQFKADATFDQVKSLLQSRLDAALKNEAEQAELAQLKKEKAEREQKDREEQIAREAAEKAKREAEIERQRIEQEKIDAENRAKAAEEARILAEKKAKEETERAAAAAVEAERRRVEAEKEIERLEQEKREANKRHRAKIEKEAMAGIEKILNEPEVEEGEFEDVTQKIINAIARGEVPHVQINY
jgi:colicin import membrane protein